jgi:hypothetical protein
MSPLPPKVGGFNTKKHYIYIYVYIYTVIKERGKERKPKLIIVLVYCECIFVIFCNISHWIDERSAGNLRRTCTIQRVYVNALQNKVREGAIQSSKAKAK